MTQDPTLFTAFEWVLMALAALIAVFLFTIVHRAAPGSPFAGRDEHWFGDGQSPSERTPDQS